SPEPGPSCARVARWRSCWVGRRSRSIWSPSRRVEADTIAVTAASASAVDNAGDLASIRGRAATGALWVLAAFAVARGLSFLSNLILARLLSPVDFGVVSFAMILIGAFTLLQDMGTPSSIVYSRR